ncbi:hypothetical protein ACIBO2_34440 [Nonomuraea sp. NPDC050022]|uniref:hypothetical protein n=1 Tax=Nonomuraea sp. NPDC050022 TaxID=3364358 RepID=UPI00378D6FDF
MLQFRDFRSLLIFSRGAEALAILAMIAGMFFTFSSLQTIGPGRGPDTYRTFLTGIAPVVNAIHGFSGRLLIWVDQPTAMAVNRSVRAARRAGPQEDVLQRGQGRQQVERLEDEPDPVPAQVGQPIVGQYGKLGVPDPDLAFRWLVETCGLLLKKGTAAAAAGGAAWRGRAKG